MLIISLECPLSYRILILWLCIELVDGLPTRPFVYRMIIFTRNNTTVFYWQLILRCNLNHSNIRIEKSFINDKEEYLCKVLFVILWNVCVLHRDMILIRRVIKSSDLITYTNQVHIPGELFWFVVIT